MRDFPLDLFLICGSQPEEDIKYFEDWNQAPNTEIEPKDIFKMASEKYA